MKFIFLIVSGLLLTPAIAADFGPAPIDYLDNVYVESVEFQRAIKGEFCEANFASGECGEKTETIIFGEAVLKFKQGFSKDPDQPPISAPFGLFILDDEIYVTFVPSAVFPSSFTNPELADPEFNFTSQELETGTRLLLGGLDRNRYFSYKKAWSDQTGGIVINTYDVDIVSSEIVAPDGKSIENFLVASVTSHKKWKLVKINKILMDFVIDFKKR